MMSMLPGSQKTGRGAGLGVRGEGGDYGVLTKSSFQIGCASQLVCHMGAARDGLNESYFLFLIASDL